MTTIIERDLAFSFPEEVLVSKHDDGEFHRQQFQSVASKSKALDFVAVERPVRCLWALEVKDYRRATADPDVDVVATKVATKTRDTLAALVVARLAATGVEREVAREALVCERIRVVFHLELPAIISRLVPPEAIAAAVQQKLRTQVRPIDADATVVHLGSTIPVPWTVTDTRTAP